MIDGKDFFDQPIKNNKITYENIRKIATGQEEQVIYQIIFTSEMFMK